MSKALAILSELQKRAQAGDPKAQRQLLRLADQAQRQQEVLGRVAMEEALEAEERILRHSGDELDNAEFLARKMEHADELTRKMALRNHKWQGLNQQAPFTRTNPVSILAGQIGNQQAVSVGQSPQQVAFWGGDDAETMPITVVFAPVNPNITPDIGLGGNAPIRPFGRVRFGTRGFLVEALVDIANGVEFTVAGSQCTLEVGLDDTSNLGTIPDPVPMAGMLSFRQVEKPLPITRTVFFDNPGGAATSGILRIPSFARDLTVYRFPYTAGFTIAFLDSTFTQVYQHVVAASTEMEPIRLTTDIVGVELGGAAAVQSARLAFGLAF